MDNNEPITPSSLVLRSEGLIKKYGSRTVVNGVSFNVRQGEIVGLLGPNGAGKTTSFYMTTGLVQSNGGRIFLGDEEITSYPVYKRARAGIGYLAQEASVFRHLSVEDNIAAVLEMTGKPREYQRQKLEDLISEFRLQKVRKNLGQNLLNLLVYLLGELVNLGCIFLLEICRDCEVFKLMSVFLLFRFLLRYP